jgi:hypothetical protein
MRVTVDLNSENVISSPGVPQVQDKLAFKRNEVANLEVQFSRAGAIVELDDSATGIFELKTSAHYDSEPLTGSAGWIKFGSGVNTYYAFQFTLINEDLDALFFVDGNPLNDVVSLLVMGEIQWTIADINHKTQTLAVTLVNDVVRTGDVIPGGGAPPDYVIDDLDVDNPQFVIEDDTLETVINL